MNKTILSVLLFSVFMTLNNAHAKNVCEIRGITSDLEFHDSLHTAIEASDLLNAQLSTTGTVAETPETVQRFQLFRVEKDFRRKNVLHYGINVNSPSCTISRRENGAPNFDSYWIMGENKGERQAMDKDDLKRIGPIVQGGDDHSVVFTVNAFKEIPLSKKQIKIVSENVNGVCQVKALVELNDGRVINMNRIFTEIDTVFGIPTGVDSIRVDGQDVATGANTTVTFEN